VLSGTLNTAGLVVVCRTASPDNGKKQHATPNFTLIIIAIYAAVFEPFVVFAVFIAVDFSSVSDARCTTCFSAFNRIAFSKVCKTAHTNLLMAFNVLFEQNIKCYQHVSEINSPHTTQYIRMLL